MLHDFDSLNWCLACKKKETLCKYIDDIQQNVTKFCFRIFFLKNIDPLNNMAPFKPFCDFNKLMWSDLVPYPLFWRATLQATPTAPAFVARSFVFCVISSDHWLLKKESGAVQEKLSSIESRALSFDRDILHIGQSPTGTFWESGYTTSMSEISAQQVPLSGSQTCFPPFKQASLSLCVRNYYWSHPDPHPPIIHPFIYPSSIRHPSSGSLCFFSAEMLQASNLLADPSCYNDANDEPQNLNVLAAGNKIK